MAPASGFYLRCLELARSLDSAYEQQDDHDEQDQSQASAGIITPTGAVWPSWQSPDQKQNKNDQQNGTHGNASAAGL
jgi:hypothetical protein